MSGDSLFRTYWKDFMTSYTNVGLSAKIKQALLNRTPGQMFERVQLEADFPASALEYSGVDLPNVFTARLMPGHDPVRQYAAVGWAGEQWNESQRLLWGYGPQNSAPHLAESEVLVMTINTDLPDGRYEIDPAGLVQFEYALVYTVANYMMFFKARSGSVDLTFDRAKDVVEARFHNVVVTVQAYGNPGQGPDLPYDLSLEGELRIYRGFYGELPFP